MSKIYVDQILPKENAQISAPNLQLPAGSVVQVVTFNSSETNSSATSTSSTSFASTGYSVTITPTSASSKIVLQCNFNANDSTANNGMVFKFYRDGSSIGSGNGQIWFNNNSTNFHGAQNLLYTDEPNTTSPITYALYFRALGGSSVRIANDWQSTNIVAMEIAQ